VPPADKAVSTSLTRQFFVAIATPIALLVVAALVLAIEIRAMSTAAQWVDHTDEVIGKVYDLQKQVVDQETGLRGFLVTNDRAFLDPYLKARPVAVLDALTQLTIDNPPQTARFKQARAVYDQWLRKSAPIADSPELLPSLRSVASLSDRKVDMDAFRELLGTALAMEQALRHTRSLAFDDAQHTSYVVGFVLLVGVAFALAFVSRRVLRGVSDTYASALGAERTAREEVEAQDWIRTNQMALSEAIQGDPAPEELGRRALERLGKSIGASVGAFYVGEPGGYRRVAAHALDRESTAEFFSDGEGVVGHVAQTRKLEHLRGLPGDYLKIKSGTGETRSTELVLVPATLEGLSLAVLEFGFARAVDPRALALLERIGEGVAVTLRSVQQKVRLRELLEESQRQSEELQTQQEELRVANEEMQAQGDALRTAHAQLEERKEELESSNASLAAQRDALERAQVSLAEKAEDLERASKYKSEFLANMSHELRTPLNSSLILAKLLADNKHENLTAEQVKFASTIYSAGNDLLVLINDILDLSKIEAGKMPVHASRTTMRDLVDPVVRTFEPIATDKKLAFAVTVDVPTTVFETDVQRVQQILRNLLSNAFKFTEKGEVRLHVSEADGGFEFAVKDTGIGIPADQQAVIFEAFRQADGTTNRRFGGTGLGLSISRDLARLLGGDLVVASSIAQGSSFSLTLPRTFAAKAPLEAPPSLSGPQTVRRSQTPQPVARRRVAPAVADDRQTLDGKRRIILIVEDDGAFAEILANLAHELEFQVLLAHNADDGIRLAVEFLPSAIVLDVNLPDHSGLSVLDRLKQNPETRHIPVHMMSVEDHAHRALSMGAVGYLQKPVNREDLIVALKSLDERFTRMRRLLVVEDDEVQRDAIRHLLGTDGVEIVAVATVGEALERLAKITFDCIVTDLTLPDASGYELLERMDKDENYAFPPVIVYTGRSLTADEEQRLRRFSSSIIVKGARSPERLLDEVTLFLHQVESELPADRQRMLRQARDREAAFDSRTILVAEDDVRNVFALSSVLEPRGAKVVIARNGREALEQVERLPNIDLVLMDIMMPEMDGLTAIREIRKRGGRFSKLPIIALTAKAMKDDQERCIEAGANDYLAKPLDVEMLLALARVWMPK
jgi:CheY-like chemotaxis protein/signal transduction histidine kinase/CHASE3 domain sensor protein